MTLGVQTPTVRARRERRERGFTVTVIPDPRESTLGIDTLYRAHRSAVYRFLLRELGDPHDAEDATQTVFVSAFRSIARGSLPRAPRPWLFAIARNAARRTWRERSRCAAGDVDPDSLAGPESPDAARRDLVGALEALPATQRQALVLHELGGLEYTEIAQATNQSVAGVETAIFRARRACRAQLRADGALDHEAAAGLLGRLVAGKLTRSERESVEAHLRSCELCAEEERVLRAARPGRRRRLLGWLLSLPEGVQRLVGILQTPSPRALAALAVAGAAVAGGGGARPAPAGPHVQAEVTRSAFAAAVAMPAVRRSSPPRQPAPAEPAVAPVRQVARPPERARRLARTREVSPRAVTRAMHAPAPRTSSASPRHGTPPVEVPARGAEQPQVDDSPGPPPPRPLAGAVDDTVRGVKTSVPQVTKAVVVTLAGAEHGVGDLVSGVGGDLTGASPQVPAVVPVAPVLETPLSQVGEEAAATLSTVEVQGSAAAPPIP
jgi:RNA polymerase sigma-70 factor (ECF subfamily)